VKHFGIDDRHKCADRKEIAAARTFKDEFVRGHGGLGRRLARLFEAWWNKPAKIDAEKARIGAGFARMACAKRGENEG
jgi:hypothetical protein